MTSDSRDLSFGHASWSVGNAVAREPGAKPPPAAPCHYWTGSPQVSGLFVGLLINDDVWKNFKAALQLKENPMVM